MRKTFLVLALAASQPTLLDSFWDYVSSLWGESSPDVGCGGDPDGRCAPQPQPDEGCGGDPDGCPKGS